MTDFEAQVLGDLHVLKAQMEMLMGIGQPGRLHQIEARLCESEKTVQKMKGFIAAFGLLLTLAHLAITFFAARRG